MSTADATAAGAPIGPVDLAVIGFRGELRHDPHAPWFRLG